MAVVQRFILRSVGLAAAASGLAQALVLGGEAATSLHSGRGASVEVTTCSTQHCRGAPAADAPETWDYRDGGNSWDIGQCCMGQGQSPLNVTAATAVQSDKKTLYWGYHLIEDPITMTNDGKVLVAEMDSHFGSVALGTVYPAPISQRWDLWKVVVHAPSEHTFQGVQVPLELQLFHRQAGSTEEQPTPDSVMVVAVGFQNGARASSMLAALGQGGLPKVKGATTLVNGISERGSATANHRLNFAELFNHPQHAGTAVGGVPGKNSMLKAASPAVGDPYAAHFWHYIGSETAPPCSTGVQWLVRHDPLPATVAQVQRFTEAIDAVTPFKFRTNGNSRHLQPTCGRTVMLRSTKDVSLKMDVRKKVPDASFERALDNAASTQSSFEDSMATPAPQYANCMIGLVGAEQDLGTAKERQVLECDALASEKQAVEEAGAGVSRLAAAEKYHGQEALCESQTKVVQALEAQVSMDRERCVRLRETLGISKG